MIHSLAFSPDASLLASGSHDDTIKAWNVETGELQQTFDWCGGWVTPSLFSNDGTYAAQLCGSSYGISGDRAWITWGGRKVLRLPHLFRPYVFQISSFTPSAISSVVYIALGTEHGRVEVLGLAGSGPF